jgi:hypothetical protein
MIGDFDHGPPRLPSPLTEVSAPALPAWHRIGAGCGHRASLGRWQ